MLNVKVLGPGCSKCKALERVAATTLEALVAENPDLEATLEYVQDVLEIERYPILFTPALVVNEQVVCAGRVPKKEEILSWYRAALKNGH